MCPQCNDCHVIFDSPLLPLPQVKQLLLKSKAVDLSKLAIPSGKTAWVAYLDIYILNLDGGLLDVCLLAAVASLASLKSLPSAVIGEDGQVSNQPWTAAGYPVSL